MNNNTAKINSLNGNGNGRNGNGNGNGYNNDQVLYSLLPLINAQKPDPDPEEGIDLRQLWSVVKHRLPLIATVALSFTAAVGLLTIIKPKVYEGKFQLLIEPAQSENSTSTNIPLLGNTGGGVDYETQIEVLNSPKVLGEIIPEINNEYPEVTYETLVPEKKAPLRISQLDETKILQITYRDEDPEKIQYVLEKLAQGYLQHSLSERQREVKQGMEYVREQLPRLRQRVDQLQERLQRFRQAHNLISPEIEGEQLSQKLIDLETQYLDTQVSIEENQSLYDLLAQQLGISPKEALTASYLSQSPHYQNLLAQLQEVEVKLAKESVRFLENSPTVEALQEEKDNLIELLRQEAEIIFGNNMSDELLKSPLYSSPSTLRLELNQQYIQAANRRSILAIREKALVGAIAELNEELKLLPVLAREYTDLKREVDVATDSLGRFLAAQENLELEAAQQALPWQLIAPAKLPQEPIYPRPVRNLALGTIGGLLLGLGAALLADRLDPVFHSAEELKESVNLPVIGLIPLEKSLDSVQKVLNQGLPQLTIGNQTISLDETVTNSSQVKDKPSDYKASPFVEAFRSLYTNIRLLGSDTMIKSIVISSSAPGEGKSTISLNLAKAAAAMGQRVLLIDADLRRPQVHRRLGLPNKQGLSNLIATGSDLSEVIQKVPQEESVSVMTAGDVPPDPTRLLSSQRMQEVIHELETCGEFDLVIYDTPPLLGFADARILGSRTQGVILVAKISKTDRSALKQSIEQMQMSQVPVLGIVANNVTKSTQGSYYYYDHYSSYYQS